MAGTYGLGGGLADAAAGVQADAFSALGQAAEAETKREIGAKQAEAARKAGNVQLGSTVGALGGMALGAKAGSIGGPMGMAIGSIVGALAGSLF